MCGRPQAQVRRMLPVFLVVPGFKFIKACEVRNFVVNVTGIFQLFSGG